MCEPCRDRYRNYGTTKRAKWKKEKETTATHLHNLREEEDKRREENGLPVRTRRSVLRRVLIYVTSLYHERKRSWRLPRYRDASYLYAQPTF